MTTLFPAFVMQAAVHMNVVGLIGTIAPDPQLPHYLAVTTADPYSDHYDVTYKPQAMNEAEARWIAYHEVCHILVDAGKLRGEERGRINEDDADLCASAWFETLGYHRPSRFWKARFWKVLWVGLVIL